MGSAATIALSLVFGLLDRASQITQLIQAAEASGKDVSIEQLKELAQIDDVAIKNLQDAIEAAKAAKVTNPNGGA